MTILEQMQRRMDLLENNRAQTPQPTETPAPLVVGPHPQDQNGLGPNRTLPPNLQGNPTIPPSLPRISSRHSRDRPRARALDTYEGKGDVRLWIMQMEDYFRLERVTKDEQAMVARDYLAGKLKSRVLLTRLHNPNETNNPFDDWPKFKA
jgi:hypothetical protein